MRGEGKPMSIVAGVDFGTLSVRVSIVSSTEGRLGSAVAEYPLHRKKEDPDYATQSHADQMSALALAVRRAIGVANVSGEAVEAIAIDTTGSSVIPVDEKLQPLDDYYLWCDHRSAGEAALITETAHRTNLEAIEWCGGVYSSEWGFSKLLHWLRNNPEKRERFVTALENCDMVTATLCGIMNARDVPRSICAMGHKWMYNERLGGFPPEEFLTAIDPLLAGMRDKLAGQYLTSDRVAGHLAPEWAEKLGLRAGIPLPVGAFDAHWDAIGAGCREGDIVNVIGTSTCIIGVGENVGLVPGVCGVVPGSVFPNKTGIEAGLSATGDIFDAIARRAGTTVETLSGYLAAYRPGQTGLLRLTWDNGDRTVLVNPDLGGVTFGWNLNHTATDELFAAIEGAAMHTRIILERMEEHGVPLRRVINAGGIPRKNEVLNQVYANVLGKPVVVPESDVTSLGSAIFAFLAAGTFATIEEAQDALCPKYRTFQPETDATEVYAKLFYCYKKLYFAMGSPNSEAAPIGDVLPTLRSVAAIQRNA